MRTTGALFASRRRRYWASAPARRTSDRPRRSMAQAYTSRRRGHLVGDASWAARVDVSPMAMSGQEASPVPSDLQPPRATATALGNLRHVEEQHARRRVVEVFAEVGHAAVFVSAFPHWLASRHSALTSLEVDRCTRRRRRRPSGSTVTVPPDGTRRDAVGRAAARAEAARVALFRSKRTLVRLIVHVPLAELVPVQVERLVDPSDPAAAIRLDPRSTTNCPGTSDSRSFWLSFSLV